MYKKIITTSFIVLTPIAIIEQHKKIKSPQLTIKQFNMSKKNNLNLVKLLDNSTEKNIIKIKDFAQEGNLESQNDIANLTRNCL